MVKNKTPSPKTTDLEMKISSLTDQLARSLADYSNLEKRIETQRELYVNLATVSILGKLIDILDDFLLAQEHLKDNGLRIAVDKFKGLLKSHGVEEIKAEGEKFDPLIMDCIEVKNGQQNTVVSVRRKGYKLNNQVIRPAQVVVGKSESKTN